MVAGVEVIELMADVVQITRRFQQTPFPFSKTVEGNEAVEELQGELRYVGYVQRLGLHFPHECPHFFKTGGVHALW